jgi:hypothetical protein
VEDSDRETLSLCLLNGEGEEMRRVKRPRLRVIAGLLKKLYLVKVRRPAALVEFFAGCAIWIALLPIWILARITWPGTRSLN